MRGAVARRLRIALTHPYCWPAVQRGGERLFADLSRYLATAGNEVVSISAETGRRHRSRHDRIDEIRVRGWEPSWLGRYDIDQPVTYLPQAAVALRRARPDVIHGMFHLDGVAARLSGRRPYLVHIQGMPLRANLERRRVHRTLFRPSIQGAAAVIAVSRAAADALASEFGIEATPILNGVFTDDFRRGSAGIERSPDPTILFPGAPDDQRKRLDLLIDAVDRLGPAWPGLRLQIAAPVPDTTRAKLEARLGPAVVFLAVPNPSAMAATYAGAWVTCLPAVREAFGLVVVESLASGTPAVAVDDGGVPEVLGEPDWLAPPDDGDGLAAALDRALRASAEDPAITDRCRALASPFDWSVRGPQFEALYRAITP
jgi:glycosyltransferase involved in cell wall biosynthesis